MEKEINNKKNNIKKSAGDIPSIDEPLKKVGSMYKLVMDVAKRAREINSYYSGLSEGLLENEGPKVDTYLNESAINIALDEIAQDKLD